MNSQTSPSEPASTPAVSGGKSSKVILFVIVGIVVLLLLAGAIAAVLFLVVLKKDSTTTSSTNSTYSSATPTPKSLLEQAADNLLNSTTATWKTYKNPTYNYTVQYPNGWGYLDSGFIANSDSVFIAPQETIDSLAKAAGNRGTAADLTFDINVSTEPTPEATGDETTEIKTASYNVDGKSGTLYTVTALQDQPGFAKGSVLKVIVVKKDDKYYNFVMFDQKQFDTLDQIMKTFKFN